MPYYLNGLTLATSTAVFTDSALTVCAADGWYSDGTVVRYQSGCLLGAASECKGCTRDCNTGELTFVGQGGLKHYSTTIDLGSGTGAVLVRVYPYALPKGFRVTYNGTVYNKFSSTQYGLLESSVAGNYTLMGQAASACDTWAAPVDYSLYKQEYNGSGYYYTNEMTNVTINPSDVQLTANEPDWCVLVIPKTAASPTDVLIEMAVPCSAASYGFGFEVVCPAALTSFSSTIRYGTAVDACAASITTTFYLAPVVGAGTLPELHDYVFQDANGTTPATDGYYGINGGASYVQVQDGIVILEGSCPP